MSRFAIERSETREVAWPDAPELDRPQALVRWGDTINRMAMQRIERRVGLRLFGRWFGYESSRTERHVETVQLTQADGIVPVTSSLPRGQVALAGGGVLAIALLGGAIGALLVPTEPQATSGAPLLTTLPASRPIAMQPVTEAPRRSGAPRAALAAPVAATPTASVSGTAVIDTAIVTDNALTLSQARAAALASGEPAYWAEGSRNGVVVAGPERSESGQLCRLVAVFTRVEGDRGSTQSTTQCRAGTPSPKL